MHHVIHPRASVSADKPWWPAPPPHHVDPRARVVGMARPTRVYVNPSTPRPEDAPLFALHVLRVLTDSRGWSQQRPLRVTRRRKAADIVVSLVDEAELVRRFQDLGRPDLVGMSATVMTARPVHIWINNGRWHRGADKGVTVRDARGRVAHHTVTALHIYRTYLLNHELGHALGLGHAPPQGQRCSIMTQQTKTLPRDCWFQAWPSAAQLERVAGGRMGTSSSGRGLLGKPVRSGR